ncbi:hypothetical protein RSAG8_05235, partial [Rhizoctonia solani AG-8 WAC10335]
MGSGKLPLTSPTPISIGTDQVILLYSERLPAT